MSKLAYNYDEAAAATGISRTLLERAVRANRLVPSYVTPAKPVFLAAELDRFLGTLPTEKG